MAAYPIVNVALSDPVSPLLARHGGKYLVRGGTFDSVEDVDG